MDTQERVDTAEGVYEAEPSASEGFPPLGQARRAFERAYLVRILTMTAGNVTRAAQVARRNRTEFYRLLQRHGLSSAAFKRAAAVTPRWAP